MAAGPFATCSRSSRRCRATPKSGTASCRRFARRRTTVELADALAVRADASEGSDARHDLIELARICTERLADPLRAIDVWCDVRRRFGPELESFAALARLFESLGRWPELASLLSEQTRVATPDPELLARLGDVHRDHTGDGRAAIDAYIAAGDPEKALRTLEGHERLLHREPLLCVVVARALGRAGRYGDAESLLRRHLEHEGRRWAKEHGSLHRELARVLHAMGRENEAFERLSMATELHPTDPAILSDLARMSLERGDLERAERTYQALLLLLRHCSDGMSAGWSRAEVCVELHELALRRDETERARDSLASALEVALESEEERLGLEQALRRRAKFDVLQQAMETRIAQAVNPLAAARALAALVSFHHERQSLGEARVAQMVERADRVRRDLRPRPSDASELDAFEKMVAVYSLLGQAEQSVELLDVMSASAASADDGVRFESRSGATLGRRTVSPRRGRNETPGDLEARPSAFGRGGQLSRRPRRGGAVSRKRWPFIERCPPSAVARGRRSRPSCGSNRHEARSPHTSPRRWIASSSSSRARGEPTWHAA